MTAGRTMIWTVSAIISVGLHVGLVAVLLAAHNAGQGDAPVAQSPVAQSPAEQSPVAQSSVEQSPVAQTPVVQPPVAQPSAVVRQPSVSRPPLPAGRVPGGIYTVRAGDSLTKIAQAYGTTPADLARMNGTTVKKLNKLFVGRKIKVPAKASERP